MRNDMRLKKIPLHIQIVVALILGAVWGSIFNVDQGKIIVAYQKGRVVYEKEVFNFLEIEFNYLKDGETESARKRIFRRENQIQAIKLFKRMNPDERRGLNVILKYDSRIEEYTGIQKFKREETVATYIKPIGTLFINLLSFLAIPLVIASLIVGAASLEDIKKLGRIGIKTFTIYIVTTAIAIIIGLTAANVIEPGKKIDESSKESMMGSFKEESAEAALEKLDVDIVDFFVGIVPKNPMKAITEGNMLQIVFFAVIFGVTLTFIEKKKSLVVLGFFDGVSDTMIKMVDFIMKIAPLGVFALISSTIAEFGYYIILTLFWYILAVVLGLLVHTLVVYPIIVKMFTKVSPISYLKGIRNAQAIGFSTSSSAATLPVTFECVEKNLGVPKPISGFVLPLGATINMDGTALYQGVAAVFIAQVYGFDLNIIQQLTVVLTAVLASIGTAPVPGVGIIMLVMILNAIHVPAEGIALILGVDRILDMCRTVTNVSGDSAVALAIAGSEERRNNR
jgi:proton glutamate symport protein